jgi:hypothetical protein
MTFGILDKSIFAGKLIKCGFKINSLLRHEAGAAFNQAENTPTDRRIIP